VAVETLVVTVTEVLGVDWLLTVRGDADSALAQVPRWAGITVAEHPAVMHLAIAAPAIHIAGTVLDPALLPHVSNLSVAPDRFVPARIAFRRCLRH